MKIHGIMMGMAGLLLAGTAEAALQTTNPGEVAIYSSYVTGTLDNNATFRVDTRIPGVSPGGPLGQEFQITSTQQLTSLHLRLQATNPTDGGSVLIYLASNGGTTPLFSSGTTLSSPTPLAGIFDSSLTSTPQDYVFSLSQTIAPGQYWIVLASGNGVNGNGNPNTTSAIWLRNNDNIGLNTAGENKFHISAAGANVSTTVNAFEMQIDAVNTPEPASIALLGMGLMGLGMARRRMQKAAK